MKHTLIILLSGLFFTTVTADAQDSFYVAGNKIYDPCGEHFIPRGINYPVLDDWDFPANMNNGNEQSAEIIKANPNIVRIAWYNDYGQPTRPAFTLTDLDSVISRFSRNGIVSVINIMDVTCSNDYNAFANRVANWWVQPQVVALIKKHQGMVMANIANEFGHVNWAGNQVAALQTWKDNYKDMIIAMRNAGIKVPIMIDAPDCGTSIDRLLATGAEFQNHDPLHNVICSAHAYWGLDDSATVAGKVQQAANAAFPVILGEIANFQTDAQPCQYNIQYTSILRAAQSAQVGWMAWCWYKDHCPSRQMTTDGKIANLSAYGQVIVNHADWGLATKAIKTFYMKNNGVCDPSGVGSILQPEDANMISWAQPERILSFSQSGTFSLINSVGRVIVQKSIVVNENYVAPNDLPEGIYIVRFTSANGAPAHAKIFVGVQH